jgi:heme exporter protein C
MSLDSSRFTKAAPALALTSTLLVLASLYAIFFDAPVEAQMGLVQKIFYFHVPSAMSMYVGFGTSALGSILYLGKRDARWDALGVSGAEVGMLFCLITLATGSLWARKPWGVYWAWDPRLTTTLLAGMVYAAYLALRGFGEAGEIEKRFAAGLALVGVPTMFLIHYSVQRWRGIHPQVISGEGGGLHPDMKLAFRLSLAAIISFAVYLIHARFRLERTRARLASLELAVVTLEEDDEDEQEASR